MKSILVFRLSSMGDVLLTLPVMKGILSSNPDLQLVFVTRKKFAPYFTGLDRLIVVPFDPDRQHKGFPGLVRLFLELRSYRFRTVVDLHGVLRTNLLDIIFLLSGCRIYRISKHRKLRRNILIHRKPGMSVPHAVIRYLNVFEKSGITGTISGSAFSASGIALRVTRQNSDAIRIGIAPLSKHETKNWGLQNVSELIHLLRLKYFIEIHLFGGPEDQSSLNRLSGPNIFNHAGILNPTDEISMIRTMDVFVSMDSANMHLASIAGVATISVWGATDPRLGFAPLYQPDEFALYADQATAVCRPCSVYGEIPCRRPDAPMICMKSITPNRVLDKISEILQLSDKKSVYL